MVSVGEVVAGRYRVDRILGQGGMGVVMAATHMGLGQRVALKLLLPGQAPKGELVERFLREAKAASLIQSEHVVRVFDVGTVDGTAPYIAMEFLDGHDLGQVVERDGPMPVPAAAGYVLQACEALAEAHRAGIVHRDLKPSNLFLARRADGTPLVKVLDFGISKLGTGEFDSALTSTTAVLGSPLYMSPEQVRSSKAVDARSDVWSLGIILYELLSASAPFSGETLTALAVAITNDAPTPLPERRAGIPPGLWQVVARCIEKAPDRRFQNVAELAVALAAFGDEASRVSAGRCCRILGVAAEGPARDTRPGSHESGAHGVPEQGFSRTDPRADGETAGEVPGLPRRRPMVALLGVGAAVVALGVAFVVLRGGSPPAAASGAPVPATVPEGPVEKATTPVAEPAPAPPVVATGAVAAEASAAPSATAAPPRKAVALPAAAARKKTGAPAAALPKVETPPPAPPPATPAVPKPRKPSID